MNELKLLKCNDEWVAVYKEEEAHNIKGNNVYDVISNACNVWGIVLEDEETNITVKY